MIGVIGCGNMASAIVRGIHSAYGQERFLTYTPSHTRAQKLAADIGGQAVDSLKGLESADTLIIACKPQQFDQFVSEFKGLFDIQNKHFISIMAAVSVETIQNKLGVKKVTRVMPNTPSLYSEGVSLMLHSSAVVAEERSRCLQYFSACSRVHLIEDENLFDKVTTVSGSGPAYVFYFAKTLADKLKKWGVAEQEAREIVVQLFKGSTKLMEKNSEITLDELIAQVTSKGGVTIEAVKIYQSRGLDDITDNATDAALARSLVMTREFQ